MAVEVLDSARIWVGRQRESSPVYRALNTANIPPNEHLPFLPKPQWFLSNPANIRHGLGSFTQNTDDLADIWVLESLQACLPQQVDVADEECLAYTIWLEQPACQRTT